MFTTQAASSWRPDQNAINFFAELDTRQHHAFARTTLFFITLEVSPKPAHGDYGTVDGAFATCWVNEPSAALAEAVAREAVEAHGWDVVELDGIREEYLGHPEGIELFDQASLDGLVITFRRWPVGGDDESTARK